MVNFGTFYDHLEYSMANWYNLWPFGIVCGHLVYVFFPIWYVWPKKNLATLVLYDMAQHEILFNVKRP
jgi:hypothetical protein